MFTKPIKQILIRLKYINVYYIMYFLFRLELEQLQKGTTSKLSSVKKDQQLQQSSSQDKNDHLTVRWLTNTITELKTELAEVQTTLNATVILQNHEQVGTEIALLKSDVQSLNKELEGLRNKNAK